MAYQYTSHNSFIYLFILTIFIIKVKIHTGIFLILDKYSKKNYDVMITLKCWFINNFHELNLIVLERFLIKMESKGGFLKHLKGS